MTPSGDRSTDRGEVAAASSATTRAGARRVTVAAARARAALPDPVLLLPALHAVPDVAVVARRAGSPTRCSTGTGPTSATRSRSTATSSSARSCTRRRPRCSRSSSRYPLAYVIAFRGGRFKNVLLGLVVVPFFTNFLIRTLAWKTILGDQGAVVGAPPRRRDPRAERAALLRTPLAVIGGLTYNFLPFMVLPIYVALEKIDPRSSTRRATCTPTPGARSARSCSRCRCRACSPAACSCSSRPPATS